MILFRYPHNASELSSFTCATKFLYFHNLALTISAHYKLFNMNEEAEDPLFSYFPGKKTFMAGFRIKKKPAIQWLQSSAVLFLSLQRAVKFRCYFMIWYGGIDCDILDPNPWCQQTSEIHYWSNEAKISRLALKCITLNQTNEPSF